MPREHDPNDVRPSWVRELFVANNRREAFNLSQPADTSKGDVSDIGGIFGLLFAAVLAPLFWAPCGVMIVGSVVCLVFVMVGDMTGAWLYLWITLGVWWLIGLFSRLR